MGVDNYDCSCFDLQEMEERALAAEAKLDRVRALAEDYQDTDQPMPHPWDVARRLRECLGEKP